MLFFASRVGVERLPCRPCRARNCWRKGRSFVFVVRLMTTKYYCTCIRKRDLPQPWRDEGELCWPTTLPGLSTTIKSFRWNPRLCILREVYLKTTADTVTLSTNKQTYPQIPTVPPRRSLSGHGLILLGGAVGISVARNPADGHLRCLGAGALVVERLSKQQSKRGVKFVSLLRTGAIPIRHCKNVTCEWVVVASDEDHTPPSTVALWIRCRVCLVCFVSRWPRGGGLVLHASGSSAFCFEIRVFMPDRRVKHATDKNARPRRFTHSPFSTRVHN